jgi:hypothetical protein
MDSRARMSHGPIAVRTIDMTAPSAASERIPTCRRWPAHSTADSGRADQAQDWQFKRQGGVAHPKQQAEVDAAEGRRPDRRAPPD